MKNKSNNQPNLLHLADYAKYAELQDELKEAQARLVSEKATLTATEQAVAQAEQDERMTEMRLLAGRATDSELATVQARLAGAKKAHALAHHRHADTEHLVGLLPDAITHAKQDALAVIAGNLRALYGERLTMLRDALLAARQANTALAEVYGLACGEFVGQDVHGAAAMTGGIVPLGPEAGWTTERAGLNNLTFAPVARLDYQTNLDLWLQDAEAMLADLPQMAARDRDRPAGFQAVNDLLVAQERERVARQLAQVRRDAEALARFE